jgi:hypothetical protein
MRAFPPEPWRLQGDLHGSLWAIPAGLVAGRLPDGVRPVGWRNRVLLVTAWVFYGPGSVLSYHELLAAVPVRVGYGIGASVAWIWVDDPASAAGGRILWGMPKELGAFMVEAGDDLRFRMSAGGEEIASCRFVPGMTLPGRWPVALRTVQGRDGGLVRAKMRAWGRIGLGRAEWRVAPEGPLAFLAGRRPLLSFRLDRMDAVFGS